MTEEKGFNMDPSWKGVIKWDGLSLLASAFALIIFVLSVIITQKTLPVPAGEALKDPLHPTLLFIVAVIGESLLLPGGSGTLFLSEGY